MRGKRVRGVSKCRTKGATRGVYHGNKGKARGTDIHARLSACVNNGSKTSANKAVDCILAYLATLGLRPSKKGADFCVLNETTNCGGPIDLVCERIDPSTGDSVPVIIELKTTAKTLEEHDATYKTPDNPNVPHIFQEHFKYMVENTEYNRHMNQLIKYLALYGHSQRLPTNTLVEGMVVVLCIKQYRLRHYPFRLRYIPGAGFNEPPKTHGRRTREKST